MEFQFYNLLAKSNPRLLAQLFKPYDSIAPELKNEREALDDLVKGLIKENRRTLAKLLLESGHPWDDHNRVEQALLHAAPQIVIDKLEEYLTSPENTLDISLSYLVRNQDHFLKCYSDLTLDFKGFVRFIKIIGELKKRNQLFFSSAIVVAKILDNLKAASINAKG